MASFSSAVAGHTREGVTKCVHVLRQRTVDRGTEGGGWANGARCTRGSGEGGWQGMQAAAAAAAARCIVVREDRLRRHLANPTADPCTLTVRSLRTPP